MKRKYVSLMAASVMLAAAVGTANAGFTYDLVVSSGPTAATNNGHTVTNPVAGTYTLQLWAQITGTTANTNDSFTGGYVGLQTTNNGAAGGYAFSGSGPNGQTGAIGFAFVEPPFLAGSVTVAAQNVSANNVAGWGSLDATSPTGWTQWNITPALVGGAPQSGDGQMINSNPDSWEVLIGTYTVYVANLVSLPAQDSQTAFVVNVPTVSTTVTSGTFKWSGAGSKPIIATIDGTSGLGSGYVPGSLVTGAAGATVNFDVPATGNVPEPASLGVLALGGMALLARRRKTA